MSNEHDDIKEQLSYHRLGKDTKGDRTSPLTGEDYDKATAPIVGVMMFIVSLIVLAIVGGAIYLLI